MGLRMFIIQECRVEVRSLTVAEFRPEPTSRRWSRSANARGSQR